eukprot:1529775-Rhodomonas_salina.1
MRRYLLASVSTTHLHSTIASASTAHGVGPYAATIRLGAVVLGLRRPLPLLLRLSFEAFPRIDLFRICETVPQTTHVSTGHAVPEPVPESASGTKYSYEHQEPRGARSRANTRVPGTTCTGNAFDSGRTWSACSSSSSL